MQNYYSKRTNQKFKKLKKKEETKNEKDRKKIYSAKKGKQRKTKLIPKEKYTLVFFSIEDLK